MVGAALARARRALRALGRDPRTPLGRAVSNANEAWLGPDFVLRVNFRGDLGRLRREATLAARLAPEARYPGVLEYGCDDEFEWLLGRRVEGGVLSRAWPRMSQEQRERAIRELADALRALHATEPSGLAGDGAFDPPHILPLEPLADSIAELAGPVHASLCDEVVGFVRDRWSAFDSDGVGVVHGDPHLENVLWDGDRVSAVLDLEWARPSWVEVDLETLLSFCEHPWRFVAEDYEDQARAEDYRRVPKWLRDRYPGLFAHARLRDRLDVLHISRTVGLIHDCGVTPGPWNRADPTDRRSDLQAVLEGRPRYVLPDA